MKRSRVKIVAIICQSLPGQHIANCVEEAKRMAKKYGCPVRLKHNDEIVVLKKEEGVEHG